MKTEEFIKRCVLKFASDIALDKFEQFPEEERISLGYELAKIADQLDCGVEKYLRLTRSQTSNLR